jgi:hypothetical protein
MAIVPRAMTSRRRLRMGLPSNVRELSVVSAPSPAGSVLISLLVRSRRCSCLREQMLCGGISLVYIYMCVCGGTWVTLAVLPAKPLSWPTHLVNARDVIVPRVQHM